MAEVLVPGGQVAVAAVAADLSSHGRFQNKGTSVNSEEGERMCVLQKYIYICAVCIVPICDIGVFDIVARLRLESMRGFWPAGPGIQANTPLPHW